MILLPFLAEMSPSDIQMCLTNEYYPLVFRCAGMLMHVLVLGIFCQLTQN